MTRTADKAKMVALPGSSHPVPVGSKALRQSSGQRWMELTLGVRRSKPLPDLSALDDKLPAERTYLTREQLVEQHGSDPQAVKAIEAFAKAHNLIVTRNEPASARMGLGGTVADVNAAFGVTLFDYSHPKLGDFRARTGPVHIPADLANAITGVFGLNNHRMMRRTFRPAAVAGAAMSTPARPWFVPTELAAIYNFPPADTSKLCIGLLEFGGGVEMPDVTEYFAKIKQTAPTVKVIAADGVSVDPSADPESTGEVMLDIDVAGAARRSRHISRRSTRWA
jgi:kumamolisin